MNKTIISECASLALLFISTAGCTGFGRSNDASDYAEMKLQDEQFVDSMQVKLNDGSDCMVIGKVRMQYPEAYLSADSTKLLQKLFNSKVLEIADSTRSELASRSYVEFLIDDYTNNFNDEADDPECCSEDDGLVEAEDHSREALHHFCWSANISVPFNKYGVVTFCKELTTEKNNVATMVAHSYVSFDLMTMQEVNTSSLFDESRINELSDLIKQKLMKQLHISDENSLIDLGYFAVDNITASNNFIIGDDGITWVYMPQEIACSSVGEPAVTLSYDELSSFLLDNNLVKRLTNQL